MREIDTLLADMLNDVCTLLKVIDRKLEEILGVLYTLEDVVKEKEQQEVEKEEREEGGERSKKWIKFATMKIIPDPLFYVHSHSFPPLP